MCDITCSLNCPLPSTVSCAVDTASGEIKKCEECPDPTAVISGPSQISQSCGEDADAQTVSLSAAGSSSPAGRPIAFSWDVIRVPDNYGPVDDDNNVTLVARDAGDRYVLCGCADLWHLMVKRILC